VVVPNILRSAVDRCRQVLGWASRWKTFGRVSAGAEIRIVTGADSSHFRSLLGLLSSVQRYEPSAEVVVWDLGLSPSQRAEVLEQFRSIQLKTFNFDLYPQYFDIKQNSGEYAWKPVVIDLEVSSARRIVIWLDAGCRITSRLRWFRRYTKALGVYSPYSAGSLRDWTHPETLSNLNVPTEFFDRKMFCGGVVGVDPTSAQSVALIRQWSECAHSPACIAPPGSNRSNHRQDQSVLSCLLHQQGLGADGRFRDMRCNGLGVLLHQDVD